MNIWSLRVRHTHTYTHTGYMQILQVQVTYCRYTDVQIYAHSSYCQLNITLWFIVCVSISNRTAQCSRQ